MSRGTIIGGVNENKICRFLRNRPWRTKLHSFDLKPKVYIVVLCQKVREVSKWVGWGCKAHYPLLWMQTKDNFFYVEGYFKLLIKFLWVLLISIVPCKSLTTYFRKLGGKWRTFKIIFFMAAYRLHCLRQWLTKVKQVSLDNHILFVELSLGLIFLKSLGALEAFTFVVSSWNKIIVMVIV